MLSAGLQSRGGEAAGHQLPPDALITADPQVEAGEVEGPAGAEVTDLAGARVVGAHDRERTDGPRPRELGPGERASSRLRAFQAAHGAGGARSEERRVGKECFGTCISRGVADLK